MRARAQTRMTAPTPAMNVQLTLDERDAIDQALNRLRGFVGLFRLFDDADVETEQHFALETIRLGLRDAIVAIDEQLHTADERLS